MIARVAPAFVMAVAVVVVGCSSQTKPGGSGGSGSGGAAGVGVVTGSGGTGTGGHEVVDAHAGGDAPLTSDPDAGDGGPQCSFGKPCHTNGDCCDGEMCFIGAVITDCASAPAGVCTFFRGGNCATHVNTCDCFNGPASCSSFPGTQCRAGSTSLATDDCFSCVACGGSGQPCCAQQFSFSCNSGLTCSTPGATCQP